MVGIRIGAHAWLCLQYCTAINTVCTTIVFFPGAHQTFRGFRRAREQVSMNSMDPSTLNTPRAASAACSEPVVLIDLDDEESLELGRRIR